MLHKKRIAQALITAGLVILLTMGFASASPGTAVVSTNALRLREQPNTSCSTLTVLTNGTAVKLLSPEENGWYKVSYRNYEGYMSAEYLNVTAPFTDDSAETLPAEKPSSENPPAETTAPVVTPPPTPPFTAVVKAGPLNVRSGPGTQYKRVATLAKDSLVNVIEISGEWYRIKNGSLTGYIFAEYITTGETATADPSAPPATDMPSESNQYAFTPDAAVGQKAMVLRGPLNIRSGPGPKYTLLSKLNVGTEITVYNKVNGWYQMTSGNYQGYVHADYIILLKDLKSSPVGAAAAEMARSLLGCRYVYGAEGPNTFDCSGLSYYIYGKLGYPIARGSSGQYLRSGYFVPISEIEPGDLVFIFDAKYDSSGGQYPTTHMGIYVGDGQFIHASSYDGKVVYSSLHNSYYTKYIVGIKRIG